MVGKGLKGNLLQSRNPCVSPRDEMDDHNGTLTHRWPCSTCREMGVVM